MISQADMSSGTLNAGGVFCQQSQGHFKLEVKRPFRALNQQISLINVFPFAVSLGSDIPQMPTLNQIKPAMMPNWQRL